LGYGWASLLPLDRLYNYYSDITSYPQRYSQYCKDVKVVSKEHPSSDLIVITTHEIWSFSYQPRDSQREKTVELNLTVRYELRPPKIVPADQHQSLHEPQPITWEILDGNPGNVSPTRGYIYFAKRKSQPELIHVQSNIAGELAISHYYYHENLDYIEHQQITEDKDIGHYLYEQDILNLDGKENRLDEPRVYRSQVKIEGLDECNVTRITDKYPFKDPKDVYNIELIAQGGRLFNNIYLNRDQVSLAISELEKGLADFDNGRLQERDEMNRTNDFVWLGYDEEARRSGLAAYLVLYFGETGPYIAIDFGKLDEVRNLEKALKDAYRAW